MNATQRIQKKYDALVSKFARRLTPDEVMAIYLDPRTFGRIAEAHRVTRCTVGAIKNRKRYAKLTADLGDAPKRGRGRPRKEETTR